jgi:CRP/FNR family cyclic AMP-dependent transcriptional regulator
MPIRRRTPFDLKIFLALPGSGRTVATYRKDQVVYSQGAAADAVFYIQKGKVKLTVVSEQGKEAVVAVLRPTQFCGEGCLTAQSRRMATATAMMDCEIMRLEKAAIIKTLRKEAAFADSCSIRARNGWRALFCCWRISARRANRNRSLRR